MISPLKCAAFPKIPPPGSAWHCGCIHAVTLSLAGGGFPESAQRNAADFRCESTFGGRSFRKAHGTVRRTAANFRAHGIALLAESNAVQSAKQCKNPGAQPLSLQKRVRRERQLEQAFGRAMFPFCRKAKQKSRPSAVNPPATHNLLPAKTCRNFNPLKAADVLETRIVMMQGQLKQQ